jgi:hypothetical protein
VLHKARQTSDPPRNTPQRSITDIICICHPPHPIPFYISYAHAHIHAQTSSLRQTARLQLPRRLESLSCLPVGSLHLCGAVCQVVPYRPASPRLASLLLASLRLVGAADGLALCEELLALLEHVRVEDVERCDADGSAWSEPPQDNAQFPRLVGHRVDAPHGADPSRFCQSDGISSVFRWSRQSHSPGGHPQNRTSLTYSIHPHSPAPFTARLPAAPALAMCHIKARPNAEDSSALRTERGSESMMLASGLRAKNESPRIGRVDRESRASEPAPRG